jgi:microsomal dipeptidase-like Zn-dependent dipeptidase|tara:strand:- start:2267 stop:3235 length:969 start_codon:yes stop_codon:yes gene_type:complete
VNYKIDNLQYCNWSKEIFEINREANLDAVHATICYHEDYDELQINIDLWKKYFENYSSLIFQGFNSKDIERAKQENKTAIFFGLQNCSPIEDNIEYVEVLKQQGVLFMQLTYNNQSLLATGCYEEKDAGITRMGREVIKEMNRVKMIIDMSHSAELSTLEAIEISQEPIVVSHANPSFWHKGLRNKSDTVLKELNNSGGMIGFSIYPHHLKGASECTLDSFCEMVAETTKKISVKQIGIGSDLCIRHPDSIVEWMRNGTWTKTKDFGEGSSNNPGFPPQPSWFEDARGFSNLERGLRKVGFNEEETRDILGNNWYNFYRKFD